MYDYDVVLERYEGTRRMSLPLDLCGTEGQASTGTWVLLELDVAQPHVAPISDPNPRAISRSGRLISPDVGHAHVVPSLIRSLLQNVLARYNTGVVVLQCCYWYVYNASYY